MKGAELSPVVILLLLVAPLLALFLACGDGTEGELEAAGDTPVTAQAPFDRDVDALVQTDALVYSLSETGSVTASEIPYVIRNPTASPLYLTHCNGAHNVILQAEIEGEWIDVWSPILPACLSAPPLLVPADGAFRDTLSFQSGREASGSWIAQGLQPGEGVYRLRLPAPLSSFDSGEPAFGDTTTVGPFVSNRFLLDGS